MTHNFFLETGARNNKLKVYEMVDHPAARALTGYLLVRGGVHQIAYARAIEKLSGADLMKMFPTPRIPTEKIPECKGLAGSRDGDGAAGNTERAHLPPSGDDLIVAAGDGGGGRARPGHAAL